MNHHLGIAVTLVAVMIAGCNRGSREDVSRTSAPKSEVPVDTTSEANATVTTPSQNDQKPDPADAMRQLRQKALTSKPAEYGIQVTAEFPRVYGAIAEIPLGENTITVVSLCDGNASLYTTTTFGVIGGKGHETVSNAAKAFVKASQSYHDGATPTTEFPYPKSDRVRFYLLTFSGVRFIDTDMASIESGENKYGELFEKANHVITEFRLVGGLE